MSAFGSMLLATGLLAMLVLLRLPTAEQPSAATTSDTAPMPLAAVAADREAEAPVGSLASADWADTPAIYELTVTGSRCSLLPVDSVPATPSPNHFYGSGQDIVELSAQLCPGALR